MTNLARTAGMIVCCTTRAYRATISSRAFPASRYSMTITTKKNTLMNINFLGPVLPTDRFVQMAFVEILNIILTANNIMDVNRMLVGLNANPAFGSLSGHFRWSYSDNHFTLWQRMEYNSPLCFKQRIFSIHFGTLASRDRERDNTIMN